MKLNTKCSECHKITDLNVKGSNRARIAEKFGPILDVQCKNCNTANKVHVNSVKAEETNRLVKIVLPSILLIGVSMIVFLILFAVFDSLLHVMGLVLLIIGLALIVTRSLRFYERDRVERFNYFKIKLND